jgi:hypothetical protein
MDVFVLANQLSKIIVPTLNAEKVYLAVLGDFDMHFHVHLLPEMSFDTRLGPYVMGDNGWAKTVRSDFDETAIRDFITVLKKQMGVQPISSILIELWLYLDRRVFVGAQDGLAAVQTQTSIHMLERTRPKAHIHLVPVPGWL